MEVTVADSGQGEKKKIREKIGRRKSEEEFNLKLPFPMLSISPICNRVFINCEKDLQLKS